MTHLTASRWRERRGNDRVTNELVLEEELSWLTRY